MRPITRVGNLVIIRADEYRLLSTAPYRFLVGARGINTRITRAVCQYNLSESYSVAHMQRLPQQLTSVYIIHLPLPNSG